MKPTSEATQNDAMCRVKSRSGVGYVVFSISLKEIIAWQEIETGELKLLHAFVKGCHAEYSLICKDGLHEIKATDLRFVCLLNRFFAKTIQVWSCARNPIFVPVASFLGRAKAWWKTVGRFVLQRIYP